MKDQSIVCLATPKYRGNYLKSTVQLMDQLAHQYKLMYVDYAYTLKDVFKYIKQGQKDQLLKILGLKSRIENVKLADGQELHLLTLPPSIPCNGFKNPKVYDFLMKINALIASRSIKRAMKKLGMDQPIIINAFQPFMGINLIDKLDEKANIYYCYDEMSQTQWLGDHGTRYEEKYLQKADHVVVTSEQLKKNKSPFNDMTSVVYNGVDFNHFSRSLSEKETSSINDKVTTIGYLGTVDDRIDLDLMKLIIDQNPTCEFRFIGRCINDEVFQTLDKYSNVHFDGPQDLNDLPLCVEKMDVCIIPFVSNEFTKSIYPLKINEYLSRGKAVVTTNFADLSTFTEHVYIANNKEEFGHFLTEALQENNSTLKDSRIEFASKNSWVARAREFDQVIKNVA